MSVAVAAAGVASLYVFGFAFFYPWGMMLNMAAWGALLATALYRFGWRGLWLLVGLPIIVYYLFLPFTIII